MIFALNVVRRSANKRGFKEGELMERLTERTALGEVIPKMDLRHNGHKKCTERLARYEDTGLEPEEIIDGKMLIGWIPVEEQLPEDKTLVIATVRHRRWISDYKSDIIPECEWVDHPEWYEVTGVYRDGENYIKLDDDMHDITTVVPIELQDEDLGNAIQEVIAWMPMPEPYKTGEGVEDDLQ